MLNIIFCNCKLLILLNNVVLLLINFTDKHNDNTFFLYFMSLKYFSNNIMFLFCLILKYKYGNSNFIKLFDNKLYLCIILIFIVVVVRV